MRHERGFGKKIRHRQNPEYRQRFFAESDSVPEFWTQSLSALVRKFGDVFANVTVMGMTVHHNCACVYLIKGSGGGQGIHKINGTGKV